MCLYVDGKKTEGFKRVGRTKVQLQKRLDYDTDLGKLITPYTYTLVEAGWLKADNPIDRITVSKKGYPSKYEIENGGIHVHSGKCDLSGYNNEIVKCWAYAEDFIAYGSKNELVFKKIWLPIEEIERIERKYRRRNKK